jgi:antitoxin HicB
MMSGGQTPDAREKASLTPRFQHGYPPTREDLPMQYKIPLVLAPQPEGGYTVTSPLFPELVTEGNTIDEALANVKDALAAVIEIYAEQGKHLPQNAQIRDPGGSVWLETVVSAP